MMIKIYLTILFLITLSVFFITNNHQFSTANNMNKPSNPVSYFEIPVTDIERAMKFYQVVFSFEFER